MRSVLFEMLCFFVYILLLRYYNVYIFYHVLTPPMSSLTRDKAILYWGETQFDPTTNVCTSCRAIPSCHFVVKRKDAPSRASALPSYPCRCCFNHTTRFFTGISTAANIAQPITDIHIEAMPNLKPVMTNTQAPFRNALCVSFKAMVTFCTICFSTSPTGSV